VFLYRGYLIDGEFLHSTESLSGRHSAISARLRLSWYIHPTSR